MMLSSKFYSRWAKGVMEQLARADANGDGRIDPDELLALLSGGLEGVDPTHNAEVPDDERDDSTPQPVTPLEFLELEVGIARDFRDAGTGRPWDRARNYDPTVYGWPKDKSRGQSLGVRDITLVDTVVLHTAAATLHEDRFVGVPCHDAIADNGVVVLCHDHAAYLAHAHKLNRPSVGIEISGHRGIAEHQIKPARALARYVVEELRRRHRLAGVDKPIKVAPHRFGHSSRVNDPDWQIWRAVGEWMLDELGCVLGDVVGTGQPMAADWWTPGRMEFA